MTRLAWPLVLAALLGCRSTASYTVPSAMINTALALGASVQQRAEGGCYAVCSYGTVCDARTGTCVQETSKCGSACQSWELCVETEAASWRCIPNSIVTVARPPGATAPGQVVPGLGVSPATGSTPTLPPTKIGPDAP